MEGLSANEISIGRQDGGSGLSKELGRTHNKNNVRFFLFFIDADIDAR